MGDKLDIHNTGEAYISRLQSLEQDTSITKKNRELISTFIRAAKAGKTSPKRQKKKVSCGTLNKYLFSLKVAVTNIKVDLDSLSKDDEDDPVMNKFITDLEENKITKQDKKIFKAKGKVAIIKGGVYTEATKRDIKITIRKFYKWLWGKNLFCPALVGWIDTRRVTLEIPALTRDQIEEELVKQCGLEKHKAFLMLLFDAGPRIQELLNVRMEHITFDKNEKCYKIRIQHSKTKPRTVYIPLATPYLRTYLQGLLSDERNNPNNLLFDYSYDYCRKLLANLSKKHLGIKITAHLLRHSSATYWCNKISFAQFCIRYGWSFNSDMPNRYIDREGVGDVETAQVATKHMKDEVTKENQLLKEEMMILRQNQEAMVKDITSLMQEKVKEKFQLKSINEMEEPYIQQFGNTEIAISESGTSNIEQGKNKQFTPR